MPDERKPNKGEKGKYLELRVARLLFSEGLTPFVNVFFRGDIESRTISKPDVDVMGCHLLPDATPFFIHYDCKSGESQVINHVLMLLGLKSQIPPGPMIYIRKFTSLDIKRYAKQYGIRIADISQIEEREKKFVHPVFGDEFPSISDREVHELWLSTKGKHKGTQVSRLLNYFDYEFWAEGPFTRLRRTIAAVQLIRTSCSEVSLSEEQRDLLIGCVIRRFVFALLLVASEISLLSDKEASEVCAEWLTTEILSLNEYHNMIRSAAELTYSLYGDPNKGPLNEADFYVPPPDYSEELINLVHRSLELHEALAFAMPGYDALVIEEAIRARKKMAESILRGASVNELESIKRWLRSVRLFLVERDSALTDWRGWGSITHSPR